MTAGHWKEPATLPYLGQIICIKREKLMLGNVTPRYVVYYYYCSILSIYLKLFSSSVPHIVESTEQASKSLGLH